MTLPADGIGLALLVFALGVKHGLDPDHLATIDGLTRFNAQSRPRLARWSGCLFSFGHGVVVTLVAGVVALFMSDAQVPGWLERVGTAISIVFLAALGWANLRAVARTPAGLPVRAIGFKGRWLGKLCETSHPVLIASVGAAFAISFDTWSQAALFSLAAMHVSGWVLSVALGVIFTAGMLLADGVNGIWVARMLERADRRAARASRIMSVVIGLLSLGAAALGAARYFSPAIAQMSDAAGVSAGLAVVVLLCLSYVAAMRRARRAGTAQ